jgi:hypothetical protein
MAVFTGDSVSAHFVLADRFRHALRLAVLAAGTFAQLAATEEERGDRCQHCKSGNS